MQWLRSHPYITSLAGAVMLILFGAFIVGKRSTVPGESSTLRVWGGIGANLQNPASNAAEKTSGQENLYTEVRSGPPFYYAPGNASIPQTQTGVSDNFDFDAFLTMLSHPSQSSTGGSSLLVDEAYSFIPTGLLSTSTPEKERTATQRALYTYGNEAASNIETFEDIYRNAPQILKNQFEDRSDPGKNAALLSLANGLAGVGNALLAMEEVPPQVKTAHERLGKSYQEMGGKLSRVPAATNDQTILDAMLAYNAAVEAYTKNYVALATLFSAYGVTFSSDDPGRIFTFTNTAGF